MPVNASDLNSRKRVHGRPKKATGPIEQTPQAPVSGNQRRTVGTSISNATRSGARRNKTRSNSSTAQLTITSNDPIPIHSSPPAFSGESRDRHLVEQLQLPNPTTALSREALEKHTRDVEPIDIVDQIKTIKRISGLLNSVDAQSSDTIVVDRQEIFNYKWGYLPPLDEEAECALLAIIADPTIAEIMVRTGPGNGDFRLGLEDNRNVNMERSSDPDPCSDEINALNLENFLQETMPQKHYHDELWRFDKAKCTESSSEALFQRTLMISLIARHTSIYHQGIGKTPVLDFSVEELWQCPPMPTKAVWRAREKRSFGSSFLTQPKPDLSLCFNRDSIITRHIWKTLPPPTKALACFENMGSGATRVFHFLTLEAKNAMTNIDADKAKYQCLNSASQALHNMYEFFNDAGSEHKKIFFDKVRFFSVVANRQGMLVRIHRALEIPEDAHPGSLIMPDQPEYRLNFEYEEFARIGGVNEYTRERVFNIFKKILKYATEDLGELIKAAASALATILGDDPVAYEARRNDDGFYRHGQPSVIPTKMDKDGSLSRFGQFTSVKKKLLKATLNTNHIVSKNDQTMRTAGNTERPPEAEPLSQRSNGAKKRSCNDRDTGSTNGENPQEANKRHKGSRHQSPEQGRNQE